MVKKKYYTLEKSYNSDDYIVWLNIEISNVNHGSFGSFNKFTGTRKECLKYCKDNSIKIKRGVK